MENKVDPDLARGQVICEDDYEFTEDLCKLYAMSIGFNIDPLNEDDFKFHYEYDEDYTTFPTIAVLSLKVCLLKMFDTPGLPRFNILNLLHGEQYLENFKAILPGTTVKAKAVLADLADKGKGMLMTDKIDLIDKEDESVLYSTCYMKFYVKNLGGFGDKGKLTQEIPAIPEREPDQIHECPTQPNLALFYRICGDVNPLHVIPSAAEMAGFERPILHGLCTYGIVARAVFEKY